MEKTITLYRAMCKEEMDSVKKVGISHKSGCYQGKLFAKTLEDAATFGKRIFLMYDDPKPNFLVKFVVSESINHVLDGPIEMDLKDVYCVHQENFDLFNKKVTFIEIPYCPLV